MGNPPYGPCNVGKLPSLSLNLFTILSVHSIETFAQMYNTLYGWFHTVLYHTLLAFEYYILLIHKEIIKSAENISEEAHWYALQNLMQLQMHTILTS